MSAGASLTPVSGLPSRIKADELSLIKHQIDRKLNAPLTSSCGRLFDAVAALIGIRDRVDYEAQAAIELEMVSTDFVQSEIICYPLDIDDHGEIKIIRLGRLFDAILQDVKNGYRRDEIAYRFHAALAMMIAGLCETLSRETGIKTVALSGGVFQNRLLFHLALEALKEKNLYVLTHKQVPANDGGIALGQAAIAAYARL